MKNIGVYGIIIVLAAFVLLLIFNPNLSCFGKRIKSPFYPLLRKKKKTIKTDDYGFRLVNDSDQKVSLKSEPENKGKQVKKTEDYGFRLD